VTYSCVQEGDGACGGVRRGGSVAGEGVCPEVRRCRIRPFPPLADPTTQTLLRHSIGDRKAEPQRARRDVWGPRGSPGAGRMVEWAPTASRRADVKEGRLPRGRAFLGLRLGSTLNRRCGAL
jgi:hypothetical protein